MGLFYVPFRTCSDIVIHNPRIFTVYSKRTCIFSFLNHTIITQCRKRASLHSSEILRSVMGSCLPTFRNNCRSYLITLTWHNKIQYYSYNVVTAFGNKLKLFIKSHFRSLDTRWRSWLRHFATSRKVACSIPDGVIGIYHWHNPTGLIMTLEYTQPLTETSTQNIFWG